MIDYYDVEHRKTLLEEIIAQYFKTVKLIFRISEYLRCAYAIKSARKWIFASAPAHGPAHSYLQHP